MLPPATMARSWSLALVIGCVGVHALPPVRLTPKGSIGAVEEPDERPGSDWEEERESVLLARGTTARADFSQVQLTYLGRDRVLSFNQWTGGYELWQFERTRLSKCDALSWPPLSSGRWSSLRYQSFVFVGYTQLVTFDAHTGALQLSHCDDAAFLPRCHGEKLRCVPALHHELAPLDAPRSPVHSLTYVGQELLLHYDLPSGRYQLLPFLRCAHPDAAAPTATAGVLATAPNATAGPSSGGGAQSKAAPSCRVLPAIASGQLPAGEQHTYLGDEWLLSFAPHEGGRYTLRKLERGPRGAGLVEVRQGVLPLNYSFSASAARHQLAALRQGQLLDYDKETGALPGHRTTPPCPNPTAPHLRPRPSTASSQPPTHVHRPTRMHPLPTCTR